MTMRSTGNFKEHRALAEQALRAKQGKLDTAKLGRRAAVLYDHLTMGELEELAFVGIPEGR